MGNTDSNSTITENDWEKIQIIDGLEIFRNKKND